MVSPAILKEFPRESYSYTTVPSSKDMSFQPNVGWKLMSLLEAEGKLLLKLKGSCWKLMGSSWKLMPKTLGC